VVSTGGVASMLHERVAVAVLPAASVARTRKVWDPSASEVYAFGDEHAEKPPASRLQVREPSFVVKEKVAAVLATAPLGPEVMETVGAVVSCTTTLNPPVATLPEASVAEHDTGVVPSEKEDPDGGVHVGVIGVGPSAAVAV
jgi:hypothetical protein